MQLMRNPRAAAQYNLTPTSAILGPVFSSISVVLLFIIPLLTMRLFSEEKKQGQVVDQKVSENELKDNQEISKKLDKKIEKPRNF